MVHVRSRTNFSSTASFSSPFVPFVVDVLSSAFRCMLRGGRRPCPAMTGRTRCRSRLTLSRSHRTRHKREWCFLRVEQLTGSMSVPVRGRSQEGVSAVAFLVETNVSDADATTVAEATRKTSNQRRKAVVPVFLQASGIC